MKGAVLVVAMLSLLLSLQDGTAPPDDEITLTGEYFWKHMNYTDDLNAVFTRTGNGKWDVEFRFVFEGELLVFRGTAEGSLTDGELHGDVVTSNPDRPQTFFFAGRFERGRFTGTHTALQPSGGTHPTGTLTMFRQGP